MGKVVQKDLVKALARRFDYQSARNIVSKLVKGASMTDHAEYSASDLKKLGAALSAEFTRVDDVLETLSALRSAAAEKAPTKAKPPAKAEAPAEKAPAKAKAPAKKAPAKKAASASRKKAPAKKSGA
jgi:hypothetical protein